MKILFTVAFLDGLHGSVIHVKEWAKVLKDLGHDVTVATLYYEDWIRDAFAEDGIAVIWVLDYQPEHAWDIVFAYHFPILGTLFRRGLETNKLVLGSLSGFETLESLPLYWKYSNAIVVMSEEVKSNHYKNFDIPSESMMVIENGFDEQFHQFKESLPIKPKRIGVISNHPPEEIISLRKISNIPVEIIGSHGNCDYATFITPDFLMKYDVIITIGKTVQYAMALGIPVFEYDHFGGVGYITLDNFEDEKHTNFSGRFTQRKISADKILAELEAGYSDACHERVALRELSIKLFTLTPRLINLLNIVDNSENFNQLKMVSDLGGALTLEWAHNEAFCRWLTAFKYDLRNQKIQIESLNKDKLSLELSNKSLELSNKSLNEESILLHSRNQSLASELLELQQRFYLFQKPKVIRIAAKMEKLRKKYSNSYKKRRDKVRRLFQKGKTQSVPMEPLKDKSYIDTLNNYFVNDFIIPDLNSGKPIDIIIPVYNGFEFLEPLFKSIIRNTSIPYRLLVCDDKSSDERVLPFLKKVKLNNEHVEFLLIENESNLGFIKTVNKLVELAENHFVLLNTDTEVPPYWLERLMYPIFKMDRVASTTPFTNAGTICSFPEYLKDNSIYQELDVSELDSFFQKVNLEQTMIEIPTGVGFCMGVNKDLVNKIGMFDEVFGKGYGEENDWCQRAIAAGYRNIHVTNLFVYHKHGGSFPSSEKQQLISQNLSLLNGRYPNYQRDIENTIQKNELEIIRKLIQLKVMNKSTYTTLIIDHYLGGGANHYTADRIKSKKSEISIILRYDFLSSKRFIIEFTTGDLLLTYFSSSFEECLLYLSEFKIDEIFINSLVSFPNVKDHIVKILRFKEELQAKLVVPVHDYFMLCPSYTLINDKTTYCGVPSDLKVCSSCLKYNDNEFKLFEKEKNIIEWRKSWGNVIQLSDEVVCFSKSSKDIVVKAYPNCEGKIKVTPHDISGRYPNIYQNHKIADRVTIGILGGINVAKGAKVVKNLVEYIDSNGINAKIVLIGEISTPIDSPSFQATGRYNREELPDLVKQYSIDKFLIPSIWPETYSYVTDEIMQLGYPVVVFNLGAPAERVRNYARGKVIAIDEIEKELFSHEDI